MKRRDFIKMLGLLCAGVAARPAQIEAFTQYYDRNSPVSDRLLALDEVIISGMSTKSTPVTLRIYKEDELVLQFAVNTFGGIMRWVAMPDQKQIAVENTLRWEFISSMDQFMQEIIASMSYIDCEGVRRIKHLSTQTGRL